MRKSRAQEVDHLSPRGLLGQPSPLQQNALRSSNHDARIPLNIARYRSWCGPEGRGFYGGEPCARPRFFFSSQRVYRLLCRSRPFSRKRDLTVSLAAAWHIKVGELGLRSQVVKLFSGDPIRLFYHDTCALRRGQSSSTWRKASCSPERRALTRAPPTSIAMLAITLGYRLE